MQTVAKKSPKQKTNVCIIDNLNKNNGSVVAKVAPQELTSIYIYICICIYIYIFHLKMACMGRNM
jgi:hypothetical protein